MRQSNAVLQVVRARNSGLPMANILGRILEMAGENKTRQLN